MSAVACACESSLLSQTTLSPNLFKKNINFENVFLLWEWVSFCFLNSRTNILGTTTLYEIRSICCVGAFSRVIDVFGGGEKGGKADAATFSDGEKENPSLLPFFSGGRGNFLGWKLSAALSILLLLFGALVRNFSLPPLLLLLLRSCQSAESGGIRQRYCPPFRNLERTLPSCGKVLVV